MIKLYILGVLVLTLLLVLQVTANYLGLWKTDLFYAFYSYASSVIILGLLLVIIKKFKVKGSDAI